MDLSKLIYYLHSNDFDRVISYQSRIDKLYTLIVDISAGYLTFRPQREDAYPLTLYFEDVIGYEITSSGVTITSSIDTGGFQRSRVVTTFLLKS